MTVCHERDTFELLCIAQQELVRVFDLQVELDGLQQYALQHHHLLLGAKGFFHEQTYATSDPALTVFPVQVCASMAH